jgi:2-polyprenyl-3-methyl-5-hydroxy-6-metoxy-1,4-benzoquinol methylase
MNDSLNKIYSRHHQDHRESGFSILKETRGSLIKNIVGTEKKVLDIGCRDGALTKYFSHGNTVLGIDIDERALAEAHKNLGIETKVVDLNGDWSELANRKFDVVVAGEVLEHLYFPENVIEKVSKHLVSGGKFVGSVPNGFSLKNRIRLFFGQKRFTSLGDPTHINHFKADELEALLQKHFSKVEIIGLGRYNKLAKLSAGWFGFDLFFVCTL